MWNKPKSKLKAKLKEMKEWWEHNKDDEDLYSSSGDSFFWSNHHCTVVPSYKHLQTTLPVSRGITWTSWTLKVPGFLSHSRESLRLDLTDGFSTNLSKKGAKNDVPMFHACSCSVYSLIFTRVRYVHRKYVSSFIRSSCLSFLSKSIFWCEVWLHTLSRKCVGIALDHASITLNSLSPDWVRACQCIQTSAALAQAVPPQPIIKATGLGKPEGTATGKGKVGETAVEVDACKQYRSYCTEWLAGRVRWKNGIKLRHIPRHVHHLAIS